MKDDNISGPELLLVFIFAIVLWSVPLFGLVIWISTWFD